MIKLCFSKFLPSFKWSTSNISSSWLFQMQFCINLSPVNENLLIILFMLNQSFQILLELWSSLFLIEVDFLLPQIGQFGKSKSLICLVFSLKFLFPVYFLQLAQCFHCFYMINSTKVTGFFTFSFISLYSLKTLITEPNFS